MARSEPLYRPIATDLRHLDDTCVTPARYDEGGRGRGLRTDPRISYDATVARTTREDNRNGETPLDTHFGKELSPW